MKTFKWKSIATAVAVIAIILAVSAGNVSGQTTASVQGIKEEKAAIKSNVAKIDKQQKRVESLEKQCREARASGRNTEVTRSELLKAKADLKHNKAYLRANKTDMLEQHRALINQREKSVREQRAKVMSTQWKAHLSLTKGKTTAVVEAQDAVDAKLKLKRNEEALKQARLGRNSDLLLVNKQIKEVNGQSPFVLSAQNAAAKTQNFALNTVK